MPFSPLLKVKLCGIRTLAEANLAHVHGCPFIGLVSCMPNSPSGIKDDIIYEIAQKAPRDCMTVLLTDKTDLPSLIAQHQRTQTKALQLVDYVPISIYIEIRSHFPRLKLFQVIHVEDETAINYAETIEPWVDMIFLDSGTPHSLPRLLGGTGRTHDWKISRSLVQKIKKPVFLAGGLNVENVSKAINFVQPYGIDLCSSLRSHGKLNPQKLTTFMKAVSEEAKRV